MDTTTAPLRVTLLVGSNRHGRFGPVVADWLWTTSGPTTTWSPTWWTSPRPTCPRPSPRPGSDRRAGGDRPKLADADAFVVLTPEYNHSFPAGLKNVIDWHYTEWRAKPVGDRLLGGLAGALRAAEHLRQVFAELHAVTVRDTVSFHNAGASFDDGGRLGTRPVRTRPPRRCSTSWCGGDGPCGRRGRGGPTTARETP
ncbi:NAD(P)H-dependent oxidoreductase [Streptomyces violaceorubidus]